MNLWPLEFTVDVRTAPSGWTAPPGAVSVGTGTWRVPVFAISKRSETRQTEDSERIYGRLEEYLTVTCPPGSLVPGMNLSDGTGSQWQVVGAIEDMTRNPWFDPGLVIMGCERNGDWQVT